MNQNLWTRAVVTTALRWLGPEQLAASTKRPSCGNSEADAQAVLYGCCARPGTVVGALAGLWAHVWHEHAGGAKG